MAQANDNKRIKLIITDIHEVLFIKDINSIKTHKSMMKRHGNLYLHHTFSVYKGQSEYHNEFRRYGGYIIYLYPPKDRVLING